MHKFLIGVCLGAAIAVALTASNRAVPDVHADAFRASDVIDGDWRNFLQGALEQSERDYLVEIADFEGYLLEKMWEVNGNELHKLEHVLIDAACDAAFRHFRENQVMAMGRSDALRTRMTSLGYKWSMSTQKWKAPEGK